MCRSRDTTSNCTTSEEHEDTVFNTLCSATSAHSIANRCSISLDHHLYNNICDQWLQRSSQQQPFIKMKLAIHPDDYTALGFNLNVQPKTSQVQVMADTGCQSCLAGITILDQLCMSRKDFIPVTMKMHAANENQITILGAAFLRFSGKTKEAKTIETRQIVYVTDSTSKIFLSREACVTLGIISQKFPTIGEYSIGPSVNTLCTFPKREQPPPPPKHPPFPATTENRGRLQQYLLDYYKSSTFNTCEHQPLPMMQGPTMRLMNDTDADPVAVHTPIPVPITDEMQ